jgi:glycosyltransferase involved in cell wall biosynthesis
MKPYILNYSDINGGAARAAYRIHQALRQQGVDSTMQVDSSTSGDWTVHSPRNKLGKLTVQARSHIGGILSKMLRTSNPIIHSPAILPSGRVKQLNESSADVLHMHWINGEMLSISDVGRLDKPTVWTLHDMWAFCGAEHYTEEFRWRDGYHKGNRPVYESGFDLNRWTWNRKQRAWSKPVHIVTPSHWLADCVQQSALMRNWPVSVVHNAIDTSRWQPIDQALARQLLHLPTDIPLLLFGAMGGSNDPRKGADLLFSALDLLHEKFEDMELVVFGQLPPKKPPVQDLRIHYTGHLHDDVSLQLLYSAVDALVIPSRQDNLPNTGVESLACGTPVIAFDTCGLPDIVEHRQTGYLSKAFDIYDLAEGIRWVLSEVRGENDLVVGKRSIVKSLRENARVQAVNKFSYPVVAEQYLQIYGDMKN